MRFDPNQRTKEENEVIELWQRCNILEKLLEFCLEPHQPLGVKAYAQEISMQLG